MAKKKSPPQRGICPVCQERMTATDIGYYCPFCGYDESDGDLISTVIKKEAV